MSFRERIGNLSNRYQGGYLRVLCVCSGGLLRSPTAAHVLSGEPYNFNTRSCGTSTDYALNLVDDILLRWAQQIVCMEEEHAIPVRGILKEACLEREVRVLGIEDRYEYRDPTLVKLIKERYDALSPRNTL